MSMIKPFMEGDERQALADGDVDPALTRSAKRGRKATRQDIYKKHGVFGAGPADDLEPLASSHGGLLRQVWSRELVAKWLSTQTIRLEDESTNLALVTDDPPPVDIVPWNGVKDAQRTRVWSEGNSKMVCPAFDLPAGALTVGGACPGAQQGQSVVLQNETSTRIQLAPTHGLRGAQRQALENPVHTHGELGRAICQSCLVGDTKVEVKGRGTQKLKDLVGQTFEVWSGIDWRETTCKLMRTNAPVVRVYMDIDLFGGVVKCTPDHEFIIGTRKIRAEHLERGMRLAYKPPPTWESTRKLTPRVYTVTDDGECEDVYDLINVGDEHHFLANGVLVSNCYAAAGANYAYTSNILKEMVRLAWCQSQIDLGTPASRETWIEAMATSIFRLPLDPVAQYKYGLKPIRIHSAGDFYSPRYAEAWIEVMNRVGDRDRSFSFWAPTRTWAAWGAKTWPAILSKLRHDNFAVRPSAYHVGDMAPGGLVPPGQNGFALGSTVTLQANVAADQGMAFDYNCPVYEGDLTDSRLNCATAVGPPGLDGQEGKPGCRACWKGRDVSISYSLHL